MASLTGTKIKDTYDSLLKVSDNVALDGTLQAITDGLGNNSALSLSTAGASVGGTLSVGQSFFIEETTVGSMSTAELGSPDTGGSQTIGKQIAFYTNATSSSRVERMRITSS